jgi:hypothetical protein
MADDSKQTVSVWMDTGPPLKESPLSENARADVCIVGAGIAGITTAYLLSQEDKSDSSTRSGGLNLVRSFKAGARPSNRSSR